MRYKNVLIFWLCNAVMRVKLTELCSEYALVKKQNIREYLHIWHIMCIYNNKL